MEESEACLMCLWTHSINLQSVIQKEKNVQETGLGVRIKIWRLGISTRN